MVMRFWQRHPWLVRSGALLLAALLVGVVAGRWPNTVAGLEDRAGDRLWRLIADERSERRVVLVDIDEASLKELGGWPWSRQQMAQLSARVQAAGAAVQVLDVTFSEPREGDETLGEQLRGANVVVAQIFSLDPAVTPAVGLPTGPLKAATCPPGVPASFGHYGLAASLRDAQPAAGHITPRVGEDGVIREMPALVCHQGQAHAALALVGLWRAANPVLPGAGRIAAPAGGPDWQWRVADGADGFDFGLGPAVRLVSPSLPGLSVPLAHDGSLRVPYRVQRSAFVSVSAADVLRGQGVEALRGSVVIVGSTAFGMSDRVSTPLSAVAAGLEVHAQTLVGLFDQSIPYTPRGWPVWQWVLVALVALLLLLATRSLPGVPAKRLPLVGLLVVLAALGAHAAALAGPGLWLPWAVVAGYGALASVLLASVEHALARAQRERLSAHLGAYLPASVAERLRVTEPSGNAQFEPRGVCVLVAEVRNFAALASVGPPSEVAALLHNYTCVAVDVIEKHGGVVETVIGDSITAVWSGADDPAGHAAGCVAAARELVRATAGLLRSNRPVAEASTVQPLALGIGIEAGSALVGSFGPARRRAHGVLGQPVGVAGRIQQMTSDVSVPVLLGPQAAALIGDEQTEAVGEYLIDTLGGSAALYTVKDWSDLVAVDPSWATSATETSERRDDAAQWSRWGAPAQRLVGGRSATLLDPRLGRRGA
jgi:adenylate cyclase